MQCPDCLGYRHDGACPPTDAEAPIARITTNFPLPCPFCGTDPGLAHSRLVGERIWYLVGCDDDECPINPQASGYTQDEAWKRWNTRGPSRTMSPTDIVALINDEFKKSGDSWHCDCGQDHTSWDGIAFRAVKRALSGVPQTDLELAGGGGIK